VEDGKAGGESFVCELWRVFREREEKVEGKSTSCCARMCERRKSPKAFFDLNCDDIPRESWSMLEFFVEFSRVEARFLG
jgi:hypothetical protein